MTAAQAAQTGEMPPEETEALPPGTLLLGDQFTILEKLGNGGFGITYLATDNYLDRNVVIKECFPEVFCKRTGLNVRVRDSSNEKKYRSVVDMFMREARSIAKMRHPNVIGVHRVFEGNNTAYIALDLIEGQDLLDIIEEGQRKLSPAQIKEIMVKLLDAIQTVHDQDMLHRDISPDNILLDQWGTPVLIDFGAAREKASRESRALSALLVVKDGYSPQEFYFSGSKQTPSSDLYALGATFYHLISGKAPPNSQTRMADAVAGNDDCCEPLAGRFGEYDPIFLKMIDKAMNVLPKDRPQSAREWLSKISAKSAKQEATILPAIDQTLENALTRLVSETNEQLKTAPPPVRKPKTTPKPQSQLVVPEWVREFNQESVRRDSSIGVPGGAAVTYIKTRILQSGGDKPKVKRAKFKRTLLNFVYLMGLATIGFFAYTDIFKG